MNKEIIILAKSIKSGDYCVAGIDKETGEWVRPVSDIDSGAVPEQDLIYADGDSVQILDSVIIYDMDAIPTETQNENGTYSTKYYWEKSGHINFANVLEQYPEILYNGNDIFGNSKHWIETQNVPGNTSLILVYLESAYVGVRTFPNRKKITLNFSFREKEYNYFTITDPVFSKPYYNSNDGYYTVQDIYVLISLAPPHTDGRRYKVVAQIFQ